jgi:hypothetical protein
VVVSAPLHSDMLCCLALLLQVLLFPGGAREVNKRVGQEYQLFWKDTPDFVRLAARCGAIIVPFAAVRVCCASIIHCSSGSDFTS